VKKEGEGGIYETWFEHGKGSMFRGELNGEELKKMGSFSECAEECSVLEKEGLGENFQVFWKK